MKIALSGSPHSGKTTTLLALRDKGHKIISESAIDLIETVNGLCGLEGSREWRKTFNVAWQDLVVARQLHLEAQFAQTFPGEDVIIDSTPLDCLAFTSASLMAKDLDPEQAMAKDGSKIFQVCKTLHYDMVFCLDTILPFNSRPETGRLQTLEDCQKIRACQMRVYSSHGMTPFVVPQMSVGARVQMIEDHIKLRKQDVSRGLP